MCFTAIGLAASAATTAISAGKQREASRIRHQGAARETELRLAQRDATIDALDREYALGLETSRLQREAETRRARFAAEAAEIGARIAAGNTEVLEAAATVEEGNADLAAARGALELARHRQSVRRTLAAQTARFARSGLDTSVGSPLVVQAKSAARGETDARIIAADTMIEVADARTRAANYRGDAATAAWQRAAEEMRATEARLVEAEAYEVERITNRAAHDRLLAGREAATIGYEANVNSIWTGVRAARAAQTSPWLGFATSAIGTLSDNPSAIKLPSLSSLSSKAKSTGKKSRA